MECGIPISAGCPPGVLGYLESPLVRRCEFDLFDSASPTLRRLGVLDDKLVCWTLPWAESLVELAEQGSRPSAPLSMSRRCCSRSGLAATCRPSLATSVNRSSRSNVFLSSAPSDLEANWTSAVAKAFLWAGTKSTIFINFLSFLRCSRSMTVILRFPMSVLGWCFSSLSTSRSTGVLPAVRPSIAHST